MTYPRRNLFEPSQGGAFHCVSRCVRRAWLCDIDSDTGKSFEHRKPLVEEVARRWLELYPPKPVDFPAQHAKLCADAVRIQVLRARLADLSWFMKSFSEPIARMANAEDK